MTSDPSQALSYFEWVDGTTWMLRSQDGQTIHMMRNVHRDSTCASDEGCIIHRPSNHAMKTWPLSPRFGRPIERTCEHGVGHPDPDSLAFFQTRYMEEQMWDVHACDGCCSQGRHNTRFKRLWMGIRYRPREGTVLDKRINPQF